MLRNKFTAPIIALVLSSLMMLMLALSAVVPALAADPCTATGGPPVTCNETETASITASAGSLMLNVNNGVNGTISFGSPTVGTSSVLTSLPIEVDDNRGSSTGTTSNGWTVNINVPSTLSTAGATQTFSPTWSYEQSPACTVASPANCTVPASGTCPTVSTPTTLSPSGVDVCNSGTASDAGEGAVTLGTQLQISVPYTAVPDTYTGTITVTVTSDT